MLQCVCSVLQCVAVCLQRVLQCVAVCYSVLQCVYKMLQFVCSVSQCVVVCRSVSQCVAVYYSVLQSVAVCDIHTFKRLRHVTRVMTHMSHATHREVAVYCSVLQCVAVCCSVLTAPISTLCVTDSRHT